MDKFIIVMGCMSLISISAIMPIAFYLGSPIGLFAFGFFFSLTGIGIILEVVRS